MDSLSFLFLLGTKYLCFRPGARIQRPTSCITGSPLQPTEYLNMWRLLVADGALLIVPTTEDLLELPVELCCLLNELGISPLSIQLPNKCCLP